MSGHEHERHDRATRPRPDRGTLIWGTLFTIVGLTYLLQAVGAWEVRGEVLLPVLLIAAGLVVLISGVTGGEPPEDEA